MTDADKTRQRLVDSIRKARSGAGAPVDSAPATPAHSTPAPARKRAPARPRPAPAAKAPRAAAKPTPADPGPPGDPFHRGRRVWPD
ncbi:MAG: hypothetical protein U5S82_11290 [Gammaproteobacteria bacterium]|nr:hypothetical protein [Gammaproteobacteria bacterium]